MSTTHIRSLVGVPEVTFGSLGADGLPDRTIFAGAPPWDIDRASIVITGSQPANERDDVRSGFHGVPPDPETITDASGDPIRVWKGQLQFEGTMRSIGTADPADVVMLQALASGLTPLGHPTNAEVEVATQVGAAQFGVADAIAAADLPTGGMVAYMPDGTVGPAAFAAIVKKASDAGSTTVDLSPVLPKATLEAEDVIRTCAAYGSLPGRALGKSMAFRADGHGWRSYAFGSRLASIEFKAEGRRLRVSGTYECAFITTAHDEVDDSASNIARAPQRAANSRVLHTLGAEVTLTDPIEDAANAPRVGGRTVICPDEWSVKITTTLTPITCWGTILGMTEMEATERMIEVSLTLATPVPALDDDFLSRSHRTLAMSWGPAPGMGLIIPAAYLTADAAGRELGGDRVRQTLTYREGLPLTVTPLAGENDDHLANSPFLIGFGLTAEA